ncbi:hypothetical protein F5X99DRAFT_400460, partial [Biscogniauxia marginata]
MASSAEALEKDLCDEVRAIVRSRNLEDLTVNNVRQRVEEKNGLEDGFFAAPEWKSRSRKLIKELADKLLSEEPEPPSSIPPSKAEDDTKSGIKRQSSDEPSPAPKRQKKGASAASANKTKSKKEESESALSDLSEFEDAPPKGKKKTTKKAPAKKEDSDSELSDLDSSEEETKADKTRKAAGRKSKTEDTESELSELEDSEEDSKKKKTQKKPPKKAPKKAPKKTPKKALDSEEEKASNSDEPSPARKRKRATPVKKRTTKSEKVESDSEDDKVEEKKESVEDADEAEVKAKETESSPETKAEDSKTKQDEDEDEETKPEVEEVKPIKAYDSGSELSSVLDEPPPKRKRKSKEPKAGSKSTASGPKELTGDESEIKKLQHQLLKCGLRKIWGIELKKYGDDSKAKIRHLRGMLRDLGMEGRFSEAKAKEIKERRELMADLEAVTEMNGLWGSEGRGGRASRSKSVVKKSLKEPSDEDEDEDKDNEDQDNEEEKPVAKTNSRVSKRMADLAFLGSESES